MCKYNLYGSSEWESQQNYENPHVYYHCIQISKLIVSTVNTREFIGKDNVQAKTLNTKISSNNQLSQEKPKIQSKSKKVKKEAVETVTSNTNNDEWASF